MLPGRFLDIDYETLVSAPEAASRALISHCSLDWQDQALRFHENRTPAATASAAQVREPIHSRSVGLWRRYAEHLAPLAAALKAGGIPSAELV